MHCRTGDGFDVCVTDVEGTGPGVVSCSDERLNFVLFDCLEACSGEMKCCLGPVIKSFLTLLMANRIAPVLTDAPSKTQSSCSSPSPPLPLPLTFELIIPFLVEAAGTANNEFAKFEIAAYIYVYKVSKKNA